MSETAGEMKENQSGETPAEWLIRQYEERAAARAAVSIRAAEALQHFRERRLHFRERRLRDGQTLLSLPEPPAGR